MAEPAREVAMTMTVDEFLAADLPEGKSELVRGELRMTPTAAVFMEEPPPTSWCS
jgi:hypothetical protein